MLFPEFITPTFFEQVRSHYPETKTDTAYLRFIMYLSLGSWHNLQFSYLQVTQGICAALEKKRLTGDYCAGKYLDRMRSKLPELVVSEWNHGSYLDPSLDNPNKHTHPRMVLEDGLSPAFRQIVQQQQSALLHTPKEELVHYRTKAKYNRIRHKQQMEQEDLEVSDSFTSQCSNLVELQQRFLHYFNNLDTHSFSIMVKDNLDRTITLAETFAFKDEKVRERNLKLLTAIRLNPKPVYYAVDGSRRLYGLGSCIPYLKRELRKELTRGWVEFDISNCHLAIIAKDWHIPALHQLLASGVSIWTHLDGYIPGASTVGKPLLKKILYSLVYGDSKKQMTDTLLTGGMTGQQAKDFFKISIIDTIFQARQNQLNYLLWNNKEVDCFGEQLIAKPKRNKIDKQGRDTGEVNAYDYAPARSILSRKAQAVELKMLEPLLQFSNNNHHIMLAVLYQFDGFSCVCKQPSRIKTHCNKLKKILDAHIASMGYPTRVEYTIN